MGYIAEPTTDADRYVINMVMSNDHYFAAEPDPSYYGYDPNAIGWQPSPLRHAANIVRFKTLGELYKWMYQKREQFLNSSTHYQYRIVLERATHGYSSGGIRTIDASALASGPEFFRAVGTLPAPPGINELLIDDSRRLLRVVHRMPTRSGESATAIKAAVELAATTEFDTYNYTPRVIPEGGSYLMRIHVDGVAARYLAAQFKTEKGKNVLSHFCLTASPSAAYKFTTMRALIDAYFDHNNPIVDGRSANASLYAFVKEYSISIEAYDPLTDRTVKPLAMMDNRAVIAFDMAMHTEQNCLRLLREQRNILRTKTLAGKQLVGVDIDRTVNLLDSIVHLPEVHQPEFERYAVQFRLPGDKLALTVCRGNTLIAQDVYYLAKQGMCRKFRNPTRELLMSVLSSAELRDTVFKALCPETNVRVCLTGPTGIVNVGIWRRLTHKGYDDVQKIAAIAQSAMPIRRRDPGRKIIRIPTS